jgi:hypothetical protein
VNGKKKEEGKSHFSVGKKNPWQQVGEGNDCAAREACRPSLLGERPGCPEATNR